MDGPATRQARGRQALRRGAGSCVLRGTSRSFHPAAAAAPKASSPTARAATTTAGSGLIALPQCSLSSRKMCSTGPQMLYPPSVSVGTTPAAAPNMVKPGPTMARRYAFGDTDVRRTRKAAPAPAITKQIATAMAGPSRPASQRPLVVREGAHGRMIRDPHRHACQERRLSCLESARNPAVRIGWCANPMTGGPVSAAARPWLVRAVDEGWAASVRTMSEACSPLTVIPLS